jgi:hypothetical protein
VGWEWAGSIAAALFGTPVVPHFGMMMMMGWMVLFISKLPPPYHVRTMDGAELVGWWAGCTKGLG